MTNYPSSLDTSTTLPAEGATTSLATNHVTAHQNLQDAVEAIEAKIGVDSSAVTTSHDYKLGEVTSTDKAVGKTATQTLTNKTLTAPTITGATITTSSVNGVTIQTAGSATDFLAANGTYVAGGVANASTTVKGIVESATSAEVTAGTATGATGAVLVVTPDALASSTPVFNGSGVSNTSRLTRLAGYTSAGNTTENTVFTTSIGANLLSTNGRLIARTPYTVSSNTVAETFTIRVKFGGTTIGTITHTVNAVGGGNNTTFYGCLEAWVINNGSTSSQNVSVFFTGGVGFSNSSNLTPNYSAGSADTTSSIDTTTSQTFTVTVQRAVGSGGNMIFQQTLIDTIKNT